MTTTRARGLVGQQTIRAVVRFSTPLDDREASGNTGLYGRDEFAETGEFPDVEMARKWVEEFEAPPGSSIDDARIEVGRWDPVSYQTECWGQVLDAEHVVETEQCGSPNGTGSWEWDDTEPVH